MGYRGHFSVDGSVGWEDRWAHMSRAERGLFVFAIANFFGAFAIALWLGGDALQGKTEAGRYWIGYKGRYREVGTGTYWFSLLQLISVFITHPLGMLAAWRGQRRAKRALNGQP